MKKLLFFFILLSVSMACRRQQVKEATAYDLPQIKDSGELVVITMYSSISYFNYRGEEMGLHYELSQQFAQSLGLKLRIEVARSITGMIEKLCDGEGDLIAFPIPITKKLKDSILFCGEEIINRQVLIQRTTYSTPILKDVTELVGKAVYVKPGKQFDRMVHLNEELGGGIQIHLVENDSITSEDLIEKVARGEISYTVSDNDIAQLNKTYFPNLNIDLHVSYDQRSSWAVRNNSPLLAKAADEWFKANQVSSEYTASLKRYFESSKAIPYTILLSLKDNKISHYDDYFKKYAPRINWDWRLLAALAHTESNFDTTVVSWAGAKGLMQLMPYTAKAMGVPEGMEHNPEENIKGAVKYIAQTSQMLNMIADGRERINFVLGAYNAGIGHVFDAMALAEKYHKNKYIWFDNVEKYILLKSNEEYFNDPVCKFGYFRGGETYTFVREINRLYKMYKTKIKE